MYETEVSDDSYTDMSSIVILKNINILSFLIHIRFNVFYFNSSCFSYGDSCMSGSKICTKTALHAWTNGPIYAIANVSKSNCSQYRTPVQIAIFWTSVLWYQFILLCNFDNEIRLYLSALTPFSILTTTLANKYLVSCIHWLNKLKYE